MPVDRQEVQSLIDQIEQLEQEATPAETDVLRSIRRRAEGLI